MPRVREHSTITAMRIVQLNMQGARFVSHELSGLLRDERVDLALVQEPYSGSCGALVGLGLAVRKAVPQGCGDPRAAVLAYNGQTSVTELDHLSNRHMVCVEVHSPVVSYAISAYFQYSDATSKHLGHLSLALREVRGSKVLVCADANAKSTIWGSSVTDDRDEQVEDFIVEHDLHVLNRGGKATFCGTRRRSFINVTLGLKEHAPVRFELGGSRGRHIEQSPAH